MIRRAGDRAALLFVLGGTLALFMHSWEVAVFAVVLAGVSTLGQSWLGPRDEP